MWHNQMKKVISTLIILSMNFNSFSALAADTTTDSNGVIKSTKKSKFEGKSDENATSYITGIAVGALTTRMLISIRPIPTDVMVAGASGAAYIAGEIISTVQYKKASKEQEVEATISSDHKKDEAQKESLDKQKKNAQTANKSIKTKSMLQKASAAGYVAAAALAGYQVLLERNNEAQCMTAGSTASAELATCASSSGVSATEGMGCAECGVKLKADIAEIQAQIRFRDQGTLLSSAADLAQNETKRASILTKMSVPCTGGTAQTIYTKVQTTCSAFLGVQKKHEATSPAGVPVMGATKHLEKLLQNDPNYIKYKVATFEKSPFNYLVNFLFPEARAGMGNLLSIGGGAAAALALSYTSFGTYVDAQISTPLRRTIIWGSLAALTYKSSSDSDDISKDIEKQIDKMDVVIGQMNRMETGIKTQGVSLTKIDLGESQKNGNVVSFSTDDKEKFPCLTTNGTSNCASLNDQYTNLANASQMDPGLIDVGSSITKLGDSLQGSTGLSGSTLAAASSIGNNSNAIKKKNDKVLDGISKSLAKKGVVDPGLKGQSDKFSKGLAARMTAAINKSGSGSFFNTNPATSSFSKNDSATTPSTTPKSSLDSKAIVPPGPNGNDSDHKGMSLNFSEDKADISLPVEEKLSHENLDIALDDIHKDSSSSIFEIISHRYMKSGYPKLLEEELAVEQ